MQASCSLQSELGRLLWDSEVTEARNDILNRIMEGEDGFDIIEEYGLEPDYLEDLLF